MAEIDTLRTILRYLAIYPISNDKALLWKALLADRLDELKKEQ